MTQTTTMTSLMTQAMTGKEKAGLLVESEAEYLCRIQVHQARRVLRPVETL